MFFYLHKHLYIVNQWVILLNSDSETVVDYLGFRLPKIWVKSIRKLFVENTVAKNFLNFGFGLPWKWTFSNGSHQIKICSKLLDQCYNRAARHIFVLKRNFQYNVIWTVTRSIDTILWLFTKQHELILRKFCAVSQVCVKTWRIWHFIN